MPPTPELATFQKPRRRTLTVTLCLLGLGFLAAICYIGFGHSYSAALPWSHHFSVRSPRKSGDLLLAVQTLEVSGAQVRLKPGRYQAKSSGHIIDIRPETDLTIDINKLILIIPAAAPPSGDGQSPPASNGRVRVEVQAADFKTTGRLMVAVDQFPAVRLNDIQVNATPTDVANVSAEVLFAKVIAAMLTDVVDAPLESEPIQRDVRPESVSVTCATLGLRSGASIHLPHGREMVLGDASKIRFHDLRYDASLDQTWKSKVDLDIAFMPPTEFAANKFAFKPGTARVAVTLDVTLNKQELTATLIPTPDKPAKLVMAGGRIAGGSSKDQAPSWEAELTNAVLLLDSLKYTANPRGDHATVNCTASLTAASHVRWERNGWHASADMLVNNLKLSVPAPEATAKNSAQFEARPEQQTILQNLVLERELKSGTIRLQRGQLAMSGSISNALSLNTALAQFNAAGGQVTYAGRNGTLITADFAAGGSIAADPTQNGGKLPVDMALRGRATAVDISTPKNDKWHLQNVDIDFKSTLGPPPGLSLSFSGDIGVLSDKLAFTGAHAKITSLDLQQDPFGKLRGQVALAFSVPKNELIDASQKELAKPITVHGSHVGKVLEADVSISDLNVDAHALRVAFVGSKLHVEGPITAHGKVITKRHIVVDIPVAGRIEKHTSSHEDFTLHARLSANATATFPPAPDLANQLLEVDFDYQKANLELGGVMGKLPLANDAFKNMLKLFGIESKIRHALPSKTTIPLFKSAKTDANSILNRIRNPQITLTVEGDQLVLSGRAEIEY